MFCLLSSLSFQHEKQKAASSPAHSESIANDGTKKAESCPNEHERNLNGRQVLSNLECLQVHVS